MRKETLNSLEILIVIIVMGVMIGIFLSNDIKRYKAADDPVDPFEIVESSIYEEKYLSILKEGALNVISQIGVEILENGEFTVNMGYVDADTNETLKLPITCTKNEQKN